MSELTTRERELVALGAALGSNCVPCIEYHLPQARKAGLTDREIRAAIRLADMVRQVPARKVLETALDLLSPAAEDRTDDGSAEVIDGATVGTAHGKGTKEAGAEETIDRMAAMMSRMMSFCGQPVFSSGNRNASSNESEAPVAEGRRGCC